MTDTLQPTAAPALRTRAFIGGDFVDAASGRTSGSRSEDRPEQPDQADGRSERQ